MAPPMDKPAAAAGEPVGTKTSKTRTRARRRRRMVKKDTYNDRAAFEQTEGGRVDVPSAPQKYYDIFFSMKDQGVPTDAASDFVKAVIVADKESKMRARQAHALHAFQRDEAKARAGILSDEGENRVTHESSREVLVKIQAELDERVRQLQASTLTSAPVSYASNRPAAPRCPSTDPPLTKASGVEGADERMRATCSRTARPLTATDKGKWRLGGGRRAPLVPVDGSCAVVHEGCVRRVPALPVH
eukprot:TRINITY_DN202_c0_g1_i10.p1 TRINITY_DN202_c0_g1~~TRINITY_DN202_c0_g1_i10.p1  ORF type:complete len:245 (+),score=32.42 TRINITY_DN202_c0_g1_i10:60-794(+)